MASRDAIVQALPVTTQRESTDAQSAASGSSLDLPSTGRLPRPHEEPPHAEPPHAEPPHEEPPHEEPPHEEARQSNNDSLVEALNDLRDTVGATRFALPLP